MDWRSFLHNDEVNVVVIGEGFGAEMERMFQADVAAAVPVTPEAWARRGPVERVRESAARLLEYWL
jgi:cardiolipin synthase